MNVRTTVKILILLGLGIMAGVVWGKTTFINHFVEKERLRPMRSEERVEAIKQVSRGFAYEYTEADFEGVSDIDLRAFLRNECKTYYLGSFEWPCGQVRNEQHAGYIIEKRMFFAERSTYAIKLWEAEFLFLPRNKTYLTKQYYKGLYRSPEAVSGDLGLMLVDARTIWDRAK